MATCKKATQTTANHQDDKAQVAHNNCTMMRIISPRTGESIIVTAEWSDDSLMCFGLAEFVFITAALAALEEDDFESICAGHGNGVGALNVILANDHPTEISEIKKKILQWLADSVPNAGEKYSVYTLESELES